MAVTATRVLTRCGEGIPTAPSVTPGDLNPAPGPQDPKLAFDGCSASDPSTPRCVYDAKQSAGMGGSSGAPGGWTVTISRPAAPTPIVITSHGGHEAFPCDTIQPGDHLVA